jgi:hypothetical protein
MVSYTDPPPVEIDTEPLRNNRWKLDEGSGTSAGDSEGATSATLQNITWQSNSKYSGGAAIQFGSASNFLTDSEININQAQGEIMFWGDGLNRGGNNFATILNIGSGLSPSTSSPTNGVRFSFGDSDSSLTIAHFQGGSRTNNVVKSISPDLSTGDYFYTVALNGDTTRVRVYDNSASLVAELSETNDRGQTLSSDIQIGDASSAGFAGTIDDVMANQANILSQSEEKQIAEDTSR